MAKKRAEEVREVVRDVEREGIWEGIPHAHTQIPTWVVTPRMTEYTYFCR